MLDVVVGVTPGYATIAPAQGNFDEYVPVAALLPGIAELGGTSRRWLRLVGVARVLACGVHPLLMRPEAGVGPRRFPGTLWTGLVLMAGSVRATGPLF